MLLMKKNNQLYLFAEYNLGYMINQGYELIKLVRLNSRISTRRVNKSHKLEDYIAEQKRLLTELEDEYKRKKKIKIKDIKILEELK